MAGWVRGQKNVCVPKIGLKFPAPLINFIFCLRKILLMWVGGSVGRGWPSPPPPPDLQAIACPRYLLPAALSAAADHDSSSGIWTSVSGQMSVMFWGTQVSSFDAKHPGHLRAIAACVALPSNRRSSAQCPRPNVVHACNCCLPGNPAPPNSSALAQPVSTCTHPYHRPRCVPCRSSPLPIPTALYKPTDNPPPNKPLTRSTCATSPLSFATPRNPFPAPRPCTPLYHLLSNRPQPSHSPVQPLIPD